MIEPVACCGVFIVVIPSVYVQWIVAGGPGSFQPEFLSTREFGARQLERNGFAIKPRKFRILLNEDRTL